MKVFLAGATGVLGRALVPRLVAAGHDVVGMTRSASKQELLRSLGGAPCRGRRAGSRCGRPAVAAGSRRSSCISSPRCGERGVCWGYDKVAEGGIGGGVGGCGGGGEPVRTEADPLDPTDPPEALRSVQADYLYLERAVTAIDRGEGLALRYGGFYGPGTSISLAPGRRWRSRSASGWQPRYASWRQGFAQGLG